MQSAPGSSYRIVIEVNPYPMPQLFACRSAPAAESSIVFGLQRIVS